MEMEQLQTTDNKVELILRCEKPEISQYVTADDLIANIQITG
jgi:hypothetical protein